MKSCILALAALALLLHARSAHAQPSRFTYAGRLNDGNAPANGSYDMQLSLFDALDAGNQIGQTQTVSPVAAANGTFSVDVDFGLDAFPGADRWLELAVRKAGAQNYTTLSPRV